MQDLVGDNTGLIHLIASILALLFGTIVLVMKKGTKKHIKMGYAYVVCMTILLTTSFMLYRLFNSFGVFHYAAILSLLVLIFGMIPVLTKKPKSKWLLQHFSFMYWSVIGLYAAFASEILTRVPETPFFGMVVIATSIILIIGAVFFRKNKTKWHNVYKIDKE